MTIVSDIEVLDLSKRVLDLMKSATREVLYRCRRRLAKEPDVAYDRLFNSFVKQMDTDIAHSADRLYQLVWTRAIDCMCYLLFEGMFPELGAYRLWSRKRCCPLAGVAGSTVAQARRARNAGRANEPLRGRTGLLPS
ncbi:hypothetical protein AWB81_06707 [Caballeronia arationis]|nr:hypothetical protein AWB81_06707 [Caballeronia arationis]